MRISGALILLLTCAACAHTPAPMTIPDYEPELGVSYVANVEEETYRYHDRFYCFVDGRWFRADAMSGPWGRLSMKYVPVAIYRVRGHLPPALEKRARSENKQARVSLVSFQLVK
ncbi:MAG: hypothetical protein ACYTEG_07410 [Planctomycetota bacterium]